MVDAPRVQCDTERLGDMFLPNHLGKGRGAISPV